MSNNYNSKKELFAAYIFEFFLISVIFSSVCIYFYSVFVAPKYKFLDSLFLHPVFGYIFWVFIFIVFARIWRKTIKVQRLHNQKSWVFYGFWTFELVSCGLMIFFLFLNKPLLYTYFIGSAIFFIFFALLYDYTKPEEISNEDWRFAPGSVGRDDDRLGFKDAARKASKRINELGGYIHVVALRGGMGSGKSSYTRMIVENLDPSSILYSYISLTETNDAKNLSQLFAERWFETLSVRYPRIKTITNVSNMRMMTAVLRESGNGFISSLCTFLFPFNIGLHKTKKEVSCEHYISDCGDVAPEVARMFGNVEKIDEKMWVVVLDEIERAPLDEVYRLVEIIERFKNEGRRGLPTRIIFVLCLTDSDLNKNLENFSNNDIRASLLKSFFLEDPKNVDLNLHVPLVSYDIKIKYVIDKLSISIDDSFSFKSETGQYIDPKDVSPIIDKRKVRNGAINVVESLAYILEMITYDTPRIIEKSFQQFKIDHTLIGGGSLFLSAVDILIVSYIRVRYPYLINYLKEKANNYVDPNKRFLIISYHNRMKEEGVDKIIESLVTEVIKGARLSDISLKDKENIGHLICLMAYFLIDPKSGMKALHRERMSNPYNLHWYLKLCTSDNKDPNFENRIIHDKVCRTDFEEGLKGYIRRLGNDELLGYSGFIAKSYFGRVEEDLKVPLFLFQELSDRVINNKIKPCSASDKGDFSWDTIYYSAGTQIGSQIIKLFSYKLTPLPETIISQTIHIFEEIMYSKSVTTALKYQLIDRCLKYDKETNISVLSEMEAKNYKSTSATIKYVIEEAQSRYFQGGQRVIYNHEEAPIFVLYQGWSGEVGHFSAEVSSIRKAAMRDLHKYPKLIANFWKGYPYNEELRNIDRFMEWMNGEPFNIEKNSHLYMPMDNLLHVSKSANITDNLLKKKINLWEEILKDKKKKDAFSEKFAVQPDKGTLRARLKQAGFFRRKKASVTK